MVLSLGLWACSSDAGDGELLPDGGDTPDAGIDCELAELQPAWLTGYQQEVVAKLTGAEDIAPSVSLSDRATPARRTQVELYLEAELQAMGYQALKQDYGNGTNVYVEAEGSAESLFVVGAHYDSVAGSPGANDNATGVAAVLSAARVLNEHGCRVHDVIFVFFDQEEIGLVGSAAFAEQLSFDGRDVRGVYTLDQLGWDQDQDLRLEIELPGAGMLAQVQATIDRHSLPTSITQTTTAGSDHSAFRAEGYPALGITEEFVTGDTTPHYHLPGDTYATVDFDFLASASALIHGLALDLSQDR